MQNQSLQLQQNLLRRKFKPFVILSVLSALIFYPTTLVLADEATTTATSTVQYSLPNATFIVPPDLKAASIAIYDPLSGQFVYQKDASVAHPMASLTKILTAMEVKDLLGQNKNAPKIITIKSIIPETINDKQLKIGEQWNPNDLLLYMLMTSSNTAAQMFSNQIIPSSSFISLLNYKAKSLGLNSIKTSSPNGLAIQTKVGTTTKETPSAYGSASDIAKLFASAYKSNPELISLSSIYRATFTSKLNGKTITHVATSTNNLLALDKDIIGGKTGFTDASGGNLVVLLKTNSPLPIVIVVLNSTVDGRFGDVAALTSSTKAFFSTI